MKYAAIAVIAALFGQAQAIQIVGLESEEVQVLVQNGNHIEMGVKQQSTSMIQTQTDLHTESKANATAQVTVQTEAKTEAQANLKMAAELPPDVYGPNGDNYGNNNPSYDYSRIKIDINTPGTGPKCKEGSWISAHWVANLMQDGRVYSDTAQEGNGEPKVFVLGGHHVIKCLDIAMTQLQAGSKAHIECPSFYAFGGALTQSFLKGGLPLPLHADVEYQLEILDCNQNPVEQAEKKKEPKEKAGLQGNRQFALHLEAGEKNTGIDLVICCQDDEYLASAHWATWPAVNCYLEEYIKHDQNQLWTWDPMTYYLKNVQTGHYLSVTRNNPPDLILGDFDHVNWNVASPHFPHAPQWFEWCPYEHTLETEIDGEAVFGAVTPNIKLRNEIKITGYKPTDTEEDIAKGVYYAQYEFRNW